MTRAMDWEHIRDSCGCLPEEPSGVGRFSQGGIERLCLRQHLTSGVVLEHVLPGPQADLLPPGGVSEEVEGSPSEQIRLSRGNQLADALFSEEGENITATCGDHRLAADHPLGPRPHPNR